MFSVTMRSQVSPDQWAGNFAELPSPAELSAAIQQEETRDRDRAKALVNMADAARSILRMQTGNIYAGGLKLADIRVETIPVCSPFAGVSDDDLLRRGEVVELHRRHSPAILSYLVKQECRETKVALAAVACLFADLSAIVGNGRAGLYSQASRLCNELAA